MAQIKMNIPVDTVADIIKHMDKSELETLELLLSKDGEELLKRKKELDEGKVKTLSADEVFDV